MVGLLLVIAVAVTFVSTAAPQIVGADHSFVVESNSMSPAIGAGSVVYVNEVPTDRIGKGDVVTFRRAGGQRVTHRVVGVVERGGNRAFRTKGDANEDPDRQLVEPGQIVGRAAFHLPLIGHVVAFAQTPLGLVSLVLVPAGALIALELRDLLSLLSNGDASTDREDRPDPPASGGDRP